MGENQTMSEITDRFKTRIDSQDSAADTMRKSLAILAEDGKRLGQEQVYEEIRKAFDKRLYFDEAESMIQLIQIRLKGK